MADTRKRNLDGVFERISGAEYDTAEKQNTAYSDIRQVGEIGQPGSGLEGVRRTSLSPFVPESSQSNITPPASQNPSDTFNLLMVDALKKSQGMGSADLKKKQRLIQQAATGRAAELTPEQLRTLSPAQQSAIRSADINALEPEFNAIQYELQKNQDAIDNYERVFAAASKTSEDFAKNSVAPDAVIANYQKASYLGEDVGTIMQNMNDKTKQKFMDTLDWDKVKEAGKTTAGGDFEYIKGTADQSSGVFDKATGTFVPDKAGAMGGGATGSGNIVESSYNDRAVRVDDVAAPSLDAINEAASAFGGLRIGAIDTSSYRTPEQQQALYDDYQNGNGGLAAPPGQSKHETGMAIDLFPDQEYIAQMKPIMEANGWVQNAGAHDLGHFEFQGTGGNLDDIRFEGDLAQVRNGLLTKGDATDMLDKYKNDPKRLRELTQAFNDPKNKLITTGSSDKYDTPEQITKGQFDTLIAERQKNGFGNKQFQGLEPKEYDNVVGWLEMQQDINSMRALKEGGKFIKTLEPEEQQRIFDEFGEQMDAKSVEDLLKVGKANTGPIAGPFAKFENQFLDARLGFNENKDRLREINTIAGKYKVEFMKNISGVAISEPEARRLGALLPDTGQQDSLFNTNMADVQDNLRNDLDKAAAKFGFNSIDEMRAGTEKTRAGEHYDFDTNTLEALRTGTLQQVGTTGEEMSDEEAYELYLEQVNQ